MTLVSSAHTIEIFTKYKGENRHLIFHNIHRRTGGSVLFLSDDTSTKKKGLLLSIISELHLKLILLII